MPLKYIDGMKFRATRRKSKWNLLLIPFAVGGTALSWYGLVEPLLGFRSRFFPTEAFLTNGTWLGNIVLYVAPFFPSICAGLLVANFALWIIPPARRALDAEARGVAGTDFKSSNLALAKGLVLTSVLMLPIAAVGATSYFYLTPRVITYHTSLFSEERHYAWSDLSAVEASCWYSRNSRNLSYALLMRDGTRIEILESGRDFLEAYPTLSMALNGQSYSFSHYFEPRCDNATLPPALKRAMTTPPSVGARNR